MMLTDTADTITKPAPAKTDPTRIDVLEHAKDIAVQQGAVRDARSFFESEEGWRLAPPTSATLSEYRHCRVCIAGAAMLAAVRLGYDGGDHDAWYRAVYPFVLARPGFNLRQIEDNPAVIVRVLDMMIAAEREKVAA